MDTSSDSDILERLIAVLGRQDPAVATALAGLPLEIQLERIVPVAVAAELRCVTPETILKNNRNLLIPLDGRRFGMRLRDALLLEPKGGRRRKRA